MRKRINQILPIRPIRRTGKNAPPLQNTISILEFQSPKTLTFLGTGIFPSIQRSTSQRNALQEYQ